MTSLENSHIWGSSLLEQLNVTLANLFLLITFYRANVPLRDIIVFVVNECLCAVYLELDVKDLVGTKSTDIDDLRLRKVWPAKQVQL